MRLSSVHARRWMLLAAPVMAVCGLKWSVGGAAAGLALWMGLGLLRPRPVVYPYPRKRGLPPARLFFGGALCVCVLAALQRALLVLLPSAEPGLFVTMLSFIGSIGFSLPLGAWTLHLPLPRLWAWGGGLALCALFLALL